MGFSMIICKSLPAWKERTILTTASAKSRIVTYVKRYRHSLHPTTKLKIVAHIIAKGTARGEFLASSLI